MTTVQTLQNAAEHHQAGRLAEAQALYRQVVALEPMRADVLRLLGVVSYQLGHKVAGLELLERSVAIDPAAETYSDMGLMLAEQRRIPEALLAYKKALELRPEFPEALYNLGLALYAHGRVNEAISAYSQALRYRPDEPETLVNLGNAFYATGRYEEAVSAYQRALELRPSSTEAYNNLANVLQVLGLFDRALAAYRDALDLQPDNFQAHNNLGQCLKAMGNLPGAIACFDRAVELQPGLPGALSNRIYALHYLSDDPQLLSRETANWNQRFGRPLRKFWTPARNKPDPDRRLRIGYISADLRNHVLARNLLPLWREHNHEHFEVLFYSDVIRPDRLTERISTFADRWINIAGGSEQEVADIIARDQLDILIDPTMHMAANRLTVFARKPAAVQCTFGGYPGGTGLEAIDYRLSDRWLDPPGNNSSGENNSPGANDHFYAEKTLRLPDTFWCYDAEGMEFPKTPEVGPLPAADSGKITFGCLNNFCKVTDATLGLWAPVLDAVPGSRLLLLAPQGSARERVMRALGERVEFVEGQPRRKYLETYQRIDIGLDTFPCNGHTTSLDSFWMGVPVITLVARTPFGRAGWSQLNNLGLPELAAHDAENFTRIAAGLAGDLPRLRRLRWTLRHKMLASPLTDAKKFAQGVEAAYRTMWRQWCDAGAGKS